MSFDKISHRIQRLGEGLSFIEPLLVAQKVIQGVYDGVHTSELDSLAAETAAYMTTVHPNYEVLAARLAVSNLHKETEESFLGVISRLHNYLNKKNGKPASLIADDVFAIVQKNAEEIQKAIDFKRDYDYSYFGFKTLCRSYLLRLDGQIVERPQHMLMRVSIGIHKDNLKEAFLTYDLMSRRIFTHASPTMFNAGTPKPQCSSCFLLTMESDSIEGIYETLAKCARISKSAGGIGLNVHCIRAAGTYIAGTNGTSNGLTPLLRVYNATARYVDQGVRILHFVLFCFVLFCFVLFCFVFVSFRFVLFCLFVCLFVCFFNVGVIFCFREESAREHLPFIWSPGMQTSLMF